MSKPSHREGFEVNGASNGIELEKLYVNFAQLTLHEAELVHQLERQLR